jgi:hypothetical protein
MPITPTSPQDNSAIIVVVLLVAGFCTVYWKTALRLIAILLIALVVYGLIMSLHSLG